MPQDDSIERVGPEPHRHGTAALTGKALPPIEVMLSGRRWRHGARWMGVLIFVFGFGLIVFDCIQAMKGFGTLSSPNYLQEQVNRMAGDGTTALVTAYVSVVGGELLRLLYLLLLGYLGSLISSKGVQFFAASESVIDEAVLGMHEPEEN